MLLASEVPAWVEIPSYLAGIGGVLFAWWKGYLKRTVDCDSEVAQAVALAKSEGQTKAADLTAQLNGLQHRAALLEQANREITADRDAWRSAHSEEVQARKAVELVAKNALDAGALGMKLIEALQQAIGGKGT